MPLAGRPMVEWSIAAFRAAPGVGSIVVACPPGRLGELEAHDLVVVEGGATRSHSVSNALAVVDTELVAIHDAARPLLTPELIEGVVAALVADSEADGAIAAAPVTDTIKRVEATVAPLGRAEAPNGAFAIESTLDRGALWAAQTPQVFRTGALRKALAAYPDDADVPTDEAMLVEAMGGRVLIHPAPAENFKVTTPLDLKLAERLLSG